MKSTLQNSIRIVILFLAVVSLNYQSTAQLVKSFKPLYQTTQKGGIVYLANVAVSCAANPTSAGGACQSGTAEVPPSGNYVDNSFTGTYVDVDNDASTFMSSSDSLNLPNCSSITWAGLFWSAYGTNPSGNKTIKIKVNNNSYQNITADSNYSNTVGYNSYHNYKNITSIVKAGGTNARFTVANIPFTSSGSNMWGGWTIVVVYGNVTQGMKQLTVFDGLVSISGSVTATVPITGFLTPLTGPVNIELGAVTFDGDRGSGYTGDQMLFNGVGSNYINLTDGINPSNDVFNSTVSYNGVLTPFRLPNLNNTAGLDADIFIPNNSAKNYIGNSATSANLKLTTGGETYLTQVVTTAIDVYEPDLRITKTVKDRLGNNMYLGTVNPGDTLTYTVTVKNFGSDTALNTFVTDSIEKNGIYVPGTMKIVSGPNSGNKTDVSSDDQVEYNPTTNILKIRIGTGANSSLGGKVGNSVNGADSTVITYKITAQTDCFYLTCDSVINNTAFVTGTGKISGNTYTTGSNPLEFDAYGCPISGATTTYIYIHNLHCTLPQDTAIQICTGAVIPFSNLYTRSGYVFYNSSYSLVTSPSVSGTYYAIKTSYSGCADTVAISVTFTKPDAGADQLNVCAGTNATLTGTNPANGTWSSQSGNPAGLTLGSTSGGVANITSVTSAVGTYNFIYTVTGGCSDTMKMVVKQPSSSTTNLTICTSQAPYSWNGLTFNTSGSQTKHLTNAAGCDSAATLNLTVVSCILPKYETGTISSAGGTAISNVLLNDSTNGVKSTLSNSTISQSGSWPSGITLNASTGAITVAAGTTPGTYPVTYQLCDKLTPSTCSTVVDTIFVTPNVHPVTENGFVSTTVGGVAISNVLSNDFTNGVASDLSNSTISQSGTWPTGITLDPATGAISVAINTTPGAYPVAYQLCDKLTPTTCTIVIDTVFITPYVKPTAEAGTVNSNTGGVAITNILSNDNTNGYQSTLTNSTVSQSGSWPTGITLDPATGSVSVAPGTTPGTYYVVYILCDKLTPTTCSDAVDTINVICSPSSSITNATICNGSSYTFNSVTYNTAGSYTAHLTNAAGCDSAATLHLTVTTLPAIAGSNNICLDSTVTFTNSTAGGTWSSSDPSIISINNSTGVALANAVGSSIITYAITGGCNLSTTLYVSITDCSGAVSGGASGGTESKSLGNAISQLFIHNITNNISSKTDYTKLNTVKPFVGNIQVMGNGNVSLQSLLPAQSSVASVFGTSAVNVYSTSPTNLTGITNALEVQAQDYTVNTTCKAVAFATKTSSSIYGHTKPVCDRLKEAELQDIQNVTINNINFMQYKLLQNNGTVEYAISFTAGKNFNSAFYDIQSKWLLEDFTGFDTMYNFQIWGVNPQVVKSMVADVLNNLNNSLPYYQLTYAPVPQTYIMSHRRNQTAMDITIKNNTNATAANLQVTEYLNELSAAMPAKILPVTINPNGITTVSFDMSDHYQADIKMLDAKNNIVTDEVYSNDGSWDINYKNATTSIQEFTVSNDGVTPATDEYRLFRNVKIKATTSDFVSVYKLMKAASLPRNISQYTALTFTANASGASALNIILVKNSITEWNKQYSITIPTKQGTQDYQINFADLVAEGMSAIDASDVTAITISFVVSNSNTALNASISNAKLIKTSTVITPTVDTKLSIYPNPVVTNSFTCSFKSVRAEKLTLKVIETGTGRVISTQIINSVEGLNTPVITIDKASFFSTNNYIVTLQGDYNKYDVQKIVIIN